MEYEKGFGPEGRLKDDFAVACSSAKTAEAEPTIGNSCHPERLVLRRGP